MYRTTLRQLKDHGVTTAWVYNFGYWQDHQQRLGNLIIVVNI